MGLLDTALSILGNQGEQGGNLQGASGAPGALVQTVIQMLTSSENGQSGLQGIVSAFQQSGLTDVVSSWIGTGQNLPISAEQIQQVLGGTHLSDLAQAAGISHESAAGHLADLLPGLIDKMTPGGQIPDTTSIQPAELLQQFSSIFGGNR